MEVRTTIAIAGGGKTPPPPNCGVFVEWVVFDYAGVINFPPPEHAGALLPQTVGIAPERFWPAYWKDRRAYDVGAVDASGFWVDVCARLEVTADADLLEVLIALDLRAWTYVNQDTVTTLKELAGRGVRLALLSNAPVELARLIDAQPWARLFRHRFFSADLRRAKPDPQTFQQVRELLGAQPSDLLLVEGRRENVTAARAAGITSVLFADGFDPNARRRADRTKRPILTRFQRGGVGLGSLP